jgi:hypothetical protein
VIGALGAVRGAFVVTVVGKRSVAPHVGGAEQ